MKFLLLTLAFQFLFVLQKQNPAPLAILDRVSSVLQTQNPAPLAILSWNSNGEIGRIGRHLAEKPDVEVTMCLGPMPPDVADFPGGIPALDRVSSCRNNLSCRIQIPVSEKTGGGRLREDPPPTVRHLTLTSTMHCCSPSGCGLAWHN